MLRLGLAMLLGASAAAWAQETVSRDHTIAVTSQVPATAGKTVKIYLRERATPSVLRKGAGDTWAPIVRDLPAVLSVEVQTLP